LPPDHDPGQHSHAADGHTHGHHDGLPEQVVWSSSAPGTRALRVGIGGPVGSGKTALVAALCRILGPTVSTVVVTNDIFTTEDAEALRRMGVLADDRIAESGGDNLTAIFSRALVDRQIFVIDVAGGDKVPRKGGPGVTTADLLVINKTDLAPLVNADLGVMDRDAKARRGALPIAFTSLVDPDGAAEVAAWVQVQLAAWRAAASV
jgi:urease accessory protein